MFGFVETVTKHLGGIHLSYLVYHSEAENATLFWDNLKQILSIRMDSDTSDVSGDNDVKRTN